jgi:hypothetical protein
VSLVRTGYRQDFEELCSGDPRLGRACVLPWDSQTFGFSAGTYKVGVDELDRTLFEEFLERFSKWVGQNKIEVCSCVVPAQCRFWNHYLNEAGFRFVDLGLRVSLSNLTRVQLPEARFTLREAQPEDWDLVEAIASESFQHGRYHADPLFPTRLADLRYRDWVRRAFNEKNGIDHVYVLGEVGAVEGFYHVTVEGSVSDLRLAAVAPALKGTMAGFDLYVSMLHKLKSLGVRRVITNISATNTAVLNVYSMLGFRFSEPETIYHWHSEKMRSGAIS